MTTNMRPLHVQRLAACMAAALGIVGGSARADIVLDDCTDLDSVGSLRNTLAAAANNAVIDVSACSTITLTQGELPVPVSVTIKGPAVGTTTIDANHNGRAFHATNAAPGYDSLSLVALTVTGGRDYALADAQGGCILGGTLILQDSVVTDCIAKSSGGDASGGAIHASVIKLHKSRIDQSVAYAKLTGSTRGGGAFSSGEFDCYSSSISGNHATSQTVTNGQGGGVFTFGSALLSGCTLDANTSPSGGGMMQYANVTDTITVTNSTISGNQGTLRWGGLYTNLALSINSSTVAYNSSAYCGGLLAGHNINIDSSIVARNSSVDSGCVDLATSATIAGANNLVSVVNTAVPALTIVAHPRLTPLADHGGPTRTHGLSLNSPAIDQGASALLTDQRGTGFARAVGASADIGAYERQADDDEIFYGGVE